MGFLRTAAGIVGLILIIALAMEVTCRLDDWIRYRTPIWSRVVSEEDLLVRDADGMHARRNSRFQKWVINEVGTRGPSAASQKSPGALRVVTVGASETFGLYESPDQEFPRQLEDSLRRWLTVPECATGGPPHRIEVLNAAIFGMSLPTVIADVAARVRRLGPDVVVVYPTPVQYLAGLPPVAATPDSTGADAVLAPTRAFYPRALGRLRQQLKRMTPAWLLTYSRERAIDDALADTAEGPPFADFPADRMALYERDLGRLISTIRAIGAEPVLVTHANWSMSGHPDSAMLTAWRQNYPRASGSLILAFDSAGADATRRVAADSAVTLVDLAAAVRGHRGPVFADYAHFTDAGAAFVARTIGEGLLRTDRVRRWCGVPENGRLVVADDPGAASR
jgi:hypothetical protein